MDRRSFLQSMAVVPMVGVLPRFEAPSVDDWKAALRVRLANLADRDPLIRELRETNSDIVLREGDVTMTSDLHVERAVHSQVGSHGAFERFPTQTGRRAPTFLCCALITDFEPGEELKQAEKAVEAISHRLSLIRNALLKRSSGQFRAIISDGEFYATEFGGPRFGGQFWRYVNPEVLQPGRRTFLYSFNCSMVCG